LFTIESELNYYTRLTRQHTILQENTGTGGIIKGQRRSDGVTVKEKVTGRKWSYWAAAVASKLDNDDKTLH
jgi:hypothetical protein